MFSGAQKLYKSRTGEMLSDIEELLDLAEDPNVRDGLHLSARQQRMIIHPPQQLWPPTGINNERSGNEARNTVAFRTESAVEVLNDGYRWRKYGRKMVKNSPNPRNYYRCCSEGCRVKKRIEREKEDSRFVITTYVGVHNHHPPFFASS